MRRLLAVAAALVALLAAAPAAWALTFTVNDPGDTAGAAPDGDCDADENAGNGPQCTLREAITEANATTASDTIVFDAAITTIAPAVPLPAMTEPTIVDGGGDVTIETHPADAAPLLVFADSASQLKAITLRGTPGATASRLLSVTGANFAGSGVALRDAPVVAAQLGGAGGSLSGSTVTGSDSHGLILSGASTSVSSTTVSGSGRDGIVLSGQNAAVSGSTVASNGGTGVLMTGPAARVSGGSVHHNGGAGILVTSQNDVVTQVVLYANGGKPIELAAGANGGIQPPQNLRIGPRRSDGSLPLTGTTSGGTLELFTGDPFSAFPPVYSFSHGVPPGDFSYNFGSEPAPGTTFALTLTGGGTSEFALVTVPSDVTSPDVAHARAVSTTEVRVVPTEPVDSASVEPGDFKLTMAGQERPIQSAGMAPDGSIALTSSGWKAGEAGYLDVTAPGALRDVAGNESVGATRYRVAAAPGDFIAPIATRMRLAPKSICLTRARRCRRPGAALTFTATEEGKVEIVVQRGNKRVGTRTHVVTEGTNRIDFDGRLRGRKLRAGRYRLLLYMTDIVGNRNPNPPITIFRVRRVTP